MTSQGVLAFVLLASCGPAGRPAGAESLAARDVACDEGVELVTACTPTGVELCFNAIDDNCNGVIDEGCGVGTGPVAFTIAWGESAANVDLMITDPTGVTTGAQNKSQGAFKIDHDCPVEQCGGQNEETVYFEGGDPPRGRYRVEVRLIDPNGARLPVCVRLGARVGSRTFGANVSLNHRDDRKSMSFSL